MRTIFLAAALALAGPTFAADDPWRGQTAAYFGVTYLDTSLEGELLGARPDEAARVALVTDILGDALAARGVEFVDLAPVSDSLERIVNPADCNGCEVRMASRLGARYAVVGEVQKVSNLIQSMNVVVRDAGTGAVVRAGAVDLRGNTDEAWSRAMRYLLEHSILTEPPG